MSPDTRERLRPRTAGWYSVERVFHPDRFESFTPKNCAGQLQSGMPNFPALFALEAGIEYLLSIGVERLDRELRPVVKALRNGLEEQGLDLLTPAAPEFASGIVAFGCDQPAEKAARLADEGIIVWGGDGRIRISAHVYNDGEDVNRCLDAIRRLQVEKTCASSQQ